MAPIRKELIMNREMITKYEHSLKCAIKGLYGDEGLAESLIKGVIKKADFYELPCDISEKYKVEGGLLEYTLDVYENLMAKALNPVWKQTFDAKKITGDDMAFVALTHSFSKMFTLKKDENGNFINYDSFCVGKGQERAVILLTSKGFKMNCEQIYAIRWCDFIKDREIDYDLIGKYPLILALAEAVMEVTIK